MTQDEKLKLCKGCRDDYYNRSGNSTDGVCWMLANAKPVQRTMVGVCKTRRTGGSLRRR